MKTTTISIAALMMALAANGETLHSPDGKLTLDFELTADGTPEYSLKYGDKTAIAPSRLGFDLRNVADLDKGFKLESVETTSVDSVWTPVWGEESEIRENFNEMLVNLVQPSTKGRCRCVSASSTTASASAMSSPCRKSSPTSP